MGAATAAAAAATTTATPPALIAAGRRGQVRQGFRITAWMRDRDGFAVVCREANMAEPFFNEMPDRENTHWRELFARAEVLPKSRRLSSAEVKTIAAASSFKATCSRATGARAAALGNLAESAVLRYLP
jgi:hypothetical protein